MKALSISENKEVSFSEKSLTEIRAVRPRVYHLLNTYPDLRESDRKLIWQYWNIYDNLVYPRTLDSNIEVITFDSFMNSTNPETIRRAAAKMRELFPGLRGSKDVQDARRAKSKSYSKKI